MANWKSIPMHGVSLIFYCYKCKRERRGLDPKDLAEDRAPMCRDCYVQMELSAIEVDMDLLKG